MHEIENVTHEKEESVCLNMGDAADGTDGGDGVDGGGALSLRRLWPASC